MKFQKFINWLLASFNIGVYNLSDSIDTLVYKLRLLGLDKEAINAIRLSRDIEELTKQIERNQEVLATLDVVKLLFMLLSITLMILINQDTLIAVLCRSIDQFQNLKQTFHKSLEKLKTNYEKRKPIP